MLLKYGSENVHVIHLQIFLHDQDLYLGEIDGQFGAKTENAVELYQAAMNLTESGELGKKALASMGILDVNNIRADDDDIVPDDIGDFEINDETLRNVENAVIKMYSPSVREDVEEHIAVGLYLIAPYLKDLQLDTPTKLALFFGQVREEVGFKFRTIENLNYSCKALPKLFKAYRSNDLAKKHGRCEGHKANQKAIADHAYANRIGNGGTDSGDGSLFMGGGVAQLTGRKNYKRYHDWLDENLYDVYMEQAGDMIMEWGADTIQLSPHAFLSAVHYWHSNKLYEGAQYGLTRKASDYVTGKVNRHTLSHSQRWKHTVLFSRLFNEEMKK